MLLYSFQIDQMLKQVQSLTASRVDNDQHANDITQKLLVAEKKMSRNVETERQYTRYPYTPLYTSVSAFTRS